MKRFSLFAFGISLTLLLGSASSRGSDDKVADDLEKAKSKFEADSKKLRADILDDFDKRETKARDKGDKKLVEKIKDEKRVFELHALLASSANKDLKKRATDQAKIIAKAYTDAKKAYFKAKKDELSAAVEKEWKELQKGGLIAIAPPGELWLSLFNGKDLSEWDHFGKPAFWKIEDGAIQGECKATEKDGIYLKTRRKDFDDFHLRMEVYCSPQSLSSFYIRQSDATGGAYIVSLSSGNRVTGSIDKILKSNKAFGYRLLKNAQGENPPAKEWYRLEVIARGNSLTTLVNGELRVEAIDEDNVSLIGAFSLGINEVSSVRIRKIEILPLSSLAGDTK